jgi:predicted PurR-regulated permease PerM
VVYGVLGTALVQAVLAGIGFLIAGVPGPGMLALLTFFVSVLPLVGTAIVWLPAAIWLFIQGSTGWGIFMVIWGLGVNNIEHVVKPLLISKGSDLPFLLIFFGVLGGAIAFGFLGIFLGPTLLAVGYRVVQEWHTASGLESKPNDPSGLDPKDPEIIVQGMETD